MRIAVFGLGYVGSVTAACLAKMGHQVVGVDIDNFKVDKLNQGASPVGEPGLDELIAEMVVANRLRASNRISEVVLDSDVLIICVGTPSRPNGSLDLQYVERVISEIGECFSETDRRCRVVLRSTALPGTSAQCLKRLRRSARRDEGLEIVYNPEFLREGNALDDFFDPSYIVVGTQGGQETDWTEELYQGMRGQIVITDWETAELLKYACNAFHALKVVFANEMGRIAGAMGVNAFQVMGLVCADTKLNISQAYLRPGFAYGGSCLPKDLRALIAEARLRKVDLPTLESLPRSNSTHVATAETLVKECAKKAGDNRIGVIGLAFKEQTDDPRESPILELVRRLQMQDYVVTAYDSRIDPDSLSGSSEAFVNQKLPNLHGILSKDLTHVVSSAPVLVVGHAEDAAVRLVCQQAEDEQFVVDLTGKLRQYAVRARYRGLCW